MIAPPVQPPRLGGYQTCPTATKRWTFDDGSVYEICPNSDFQGNSYLVVDKVLSDWSCLRMCNLDSRCTVSVFDNQYLYCHLKDTSSGNWVASNQFSVGRLVQRGSRSVAPYQGLGRWRNPVMLPVNPVGAYIVPGTNRFMGFSGWGDNEFYLAEGMTQFVDYDFTTGVTSKRTVSNTGHDMFCPGMSTLADGRMVITGGANAEKTSVYNPLNNGFSPAANMNIARGYQTSCTLADGRVFTIGGGYSGGVGNKYAEVYDPSANKWSVIRGPNVDAASTAEGNRGAADNHMWLVTWKGSSVFQAGPSKAQNWFGTAGAGNTTLSGTRSNTDAMCGMWVIYDAVEGKIWSGGGSPEYTNSDAITDAHITTITNPYQPARVQQVAALPRARGFGNVAVLPDGTILVSGGQARSMVFTDTNSVLVAELYDPAKNTWRTLAAAKTPRNYHSISLLLADGSVLTGGGGLCWTAQGRSTANCARQNDHPSAEIFSPPYLFNADGTWAARPAINSVSSTTLRAGDRLTINVSDASVTFSLIRLGSATHSVNSDQRRVPLRQGTANGNSWTFTLPGDYGVMPPGYYYLFAVNVKGTPSYATVVRISL
ncbi:hypothetical protein Micbo1qcDRAFT_150644 [Microdochium bolleyi]|uniref:Galactose oxidase-like Early set domain-containing protein n=1 Tax=Microdochium bolleyi TaxID=196109 RepID=A0A136IV61_9PEZI|nr:hypothetical protein Micbo1qcDRAFT_150644 [Microdochium bolleyi]